MLSKEHNYYPLSLAEMGLYLRANSIMSDIEGLLVEVNLNVEMCGQYVEFVDKLGLS